MQFSQQFILHRRSDASCRVTLCYFFSNVQFILAGVGWGELFGTEFKMAVGKNKRNKFRVHALLEESYCRGDTLCNGFAICCNALQ